MSSEPAPLDRFAGTPAGPSSCAPLPPTRVIQPTRGWLSLDLRSLWLHRELVYFLAWRDIRLRYRQTLLGVGWAVIQPVSTMLVFSLFFGRLGKIPSDGAPYPVFAFCALLPWQLFAYALLESSNSLVNHKQMLTKVYFPRLAIPIASVVAGVVDFLVAFVLLVLLMAWYGKGVGPRALALPALSVLALITALGIGLWLAALNVRYRDIRYTIPFLTQLWLLATPVAYPSSLVPERWRPLLGLNPMSGVVEGFRWALLGTPAPSFRLVAVSVAVAAVFLASGLLYFRRLERTFADVV